MNKILVFDMDGTLADLYGVENWFTDLRSENPRPYIEAKPLYNMEKLVAILKLLKITADYKVIVTSWLSKGATKKYDDEVRTAKRKWLAKYDFPYDEIHLIKYGTTKANCTRKQGGYQILIDDNEKVRKGWTLGATVDASADIMKPLINLLINELEN